MDDFIIIRPVFSMCCILNRYSNILSPEIEEVIPKSLWKIYIARVHKVIIFFCTKLCMLKHRWRKWIRLKNSTPRNRPISGGRIFRFFIQFLSHVLDTWGEGNIGLSRNSYAAVWPIGYPQLIKFWFSLIFRSDFGYFHQNFTKSYIKWNFVLIILPKNFVEDKRYLKELQKQFWENIMVKKKFYGVRLWAIFSNFGQNMKGWKITIGAEISISKKKYFFARSNKVYVFSFRIFFHLCFWVKSYDRLFSCILQ